MPVISAGLLPLRGQPSPLCYRFGAQIGLFEAAEFTPSLQQFGNELRRIAPQLRLNGLAIKFERRRGERIVTLNAERVATSQPSTDDPPS
jgi:hypothetical protein